ncbi:hypothetical protein [Tropicimonas isoalkanivorans]|uniref:Uncharacterized protein n=1 Tax=Tropicimonas isoalkanivorans TaxID=441112 RepID=A0A1I1IH25_9RHOB|nr:hypothetical protein [Tropicimonas isoalkanivorans]SFC35597.1 hypothetical protein SAMN04488094_10490 [Tropicimonas isoalkanivorans]
MIALDDIEDMTCLSRKEIAALAEHEHIGDFDASMLAEYLMHLPKGPQKVQQMICEDMREAIRHGDLDHARELFLTLQHFVKDHPEAIRGAA